MTKSIAGTKRDSKAPAQPAGQKTGKSAPGARSSDAISTGKDGRNANDKDGNEAQGKPVSKTTVGRR